MPQERTYRFAVEWARQATWGGGRTDTRRGAVRAPGTRGVSSRRRASVAPCRSESPEGGFRECDAGPCCPDEAPADARGAEAQPAGGATSSRRSVPVCVFFSYTCSRPGPHPVSCFHRQGRRRPWPGRGGCRGRRRAGQTRRLLGARCHRMGFW